MRKPDGEDLAKKEADEAEIIQQFLPKPLVESEVSTLIDSAISETGASSIKEMGKVMAWLKPKVTGKADMSQGECAGQIKVRLIGLLLRLESQHI